MNSTFFFFLVLFFVFQSYSGETKLTMNVRGIHCRSCVSMIKKTVRKVPGVKTVSVDMERGIVDVECDSSTVQLGTISEAIERMGYDVVDADSTMKAIDGTKEMPHQ